MLNAGKRSLALDLKEAEAQQRLRQLLMDADVLIEFSTGRFWLDSVWTRRLYA